MLKKCLGLIVAVILILSAFGIFASLKKDTAYAATATTIGAYRWDAWHGGSGTIYQAVKTAMSPAAYHYKIPFFGVVNGDGTVDIDDTDVQSKMDQEITYAQNGGLDYWAFLRYVDYSTLTPPLHPMNESYAKYQTSPNKINLKFCFILSHSLYDSNAADWSGEKTKILNAMLDSQWQKVLGNRPLLYVLYDAGGSNLQSRLNELRTLAQSNGLGNPYIVGIDLNPVTYGLDAETDWVGAGGSSTSTPAAWVNFSNQNKSKNQSLLNGSSKTVMTAHVNWDSRPYADNPPPWWSNPPYLWYAMPTSEQYRDLVQDAVNKSQANPTKNEANTIFVYAWNEFSEGGIMSPTKRLDGSIDTTVLDGLALVNKLGPSPTPTPPPYIVDDNFDSMTTGSAPTGWTLNTAGGTITVQEIPSVTDKSVKINDTNASQTTQADRTFTATGGTTTIEYNIRAEQINQIFGAAYVYNTSGTAIGDIYFNSDGSMYGHNGSTGTLLQSYTAGTWYAIRMVVNTSTDKYDIYVNGVLKGSGFNLRALTTDVGKLSFFFGTTYTGTMYFDDVKVYQ